MNFLLPLPAFNPELLAIDIAGVRFAVRWYALSYIAGFLIAWRWFVSMIEQPELWKSQPPMDRKLSDQLLTYIVIGVIIGGRLGYVLFYNPVYFFQNPLEIIAIWQGGMSFHGGFMGLIVAVVLFCLVHRLPTLNVGDAIAVVAMPGLFFGRIANFINGELWGEPSRLPWAVIYPNGPAAICPADWVGVCSRHPSQIYEAILEGALLCLIFAYLAYKRQAFFVPGQIIGLFFIGYGIARVVSEQFRVADIQMISSDNPKGHIIQFAEWGLSMGQTLSLPMIVLGGGIFIWARVRQP